jgi:hypothetical protein
VLVRRSIQTDFCLNEHNIAGLKFQRAARTKCLFNPILGNDKVNLCLGEAWNRGSCGVLAN